MLTRRESSLSQDREVPLPGLSTNVRETQEVERLRLAFATLAPIRLMRQMQQAKLRALKEELRRRKPTLIGAQGVYLRAVLIGHCRYYGVPMNGPALTSFHEAVGHLWWRTLRRRSQKHVPWRRLRRSIHRWFPPVRICHPYPLERLCVITQGGSRMR